MAKPWTSKEQKLCSELYSAGGLPLAMESIDRSNTSIITRMSKLNVKSPISSVENLDPLINGRWYAEDVAKIFELASAGIKHSIIAEYFNTAKRNIEKILYNARKNGFDAYPLRSK